MEDRLQCVKHGGIIKENNFYNAPDDSIWSGIGKIAICKNCLREMVDEYYEQTMVIEDTIMLMCRAIDMGFHAESYGQVMDKAPKNADPKLIFTRYITQMNSLGAEHGLRTNFDTGESIKEVFNSLTEESTEVVEIEDEDMEIAKEIENMLGYDPFEGYPEIDKIELNKTLLPYLEDENLLEENYKLSQVIQIVVMTNDLNKINKVIALNSRDTDSLIQKAKEIDSLNGIRKAINEQIKSIAKDNNISNAKGNAKKASWVAMNERLSKMDFEKAKVNFYNQKRAYGMQLASDISMKSMSEFLKFDNTDAKEIVAEQRKLLLEEKDKREVLEEELRLAKVEISKLNGDKDE